MLNLVNILIQELDESNDTSSDEFVQTDIKRRKVKSSSKEAASVASETMTSSRKMSKICSSLHENGFNLPTTTQSAVNKQILRNAKKSQQYRI